MYIYIYIYIYSRKKQSTFYKVIAATAFVNLCQRLPYIRVHLIFKTPNSTKKMHIKGCIKTDRCNS